MKFNWSVIGHKKIVEYLQGSIENGHINHAYFFYGAWGLGKAQVAEYFVQSIFCLSDKERPCGVCSHCRQTVKQVHPDIVYLNKEEGKKNISVEQVREMKIKMQSGSLLNSYKVVIIREANALSVGASNAMLKILEEPMGKTVFMFLAESLQNIPETILSRMQVIKFLPVGKREYQDYLVNSLGKSKEEAYKLASLATGYPGRAVENREKERAEILADITGDINQRFKLAEKLAGQTNAEKTRGQVISFLDELMFIVRDMALIKNMNFSNVSNTGLRDRLAQVVVKYSSQKLVNILERIEKTKELIKRNINTRLALEVLMLEF